MVSWLLNSPFCRGVSTEGKFAVARNSHALFAFAMNPAVSRRSFLKASSVASAAVAFPHVTRSQQGQSPNNRLNVACIGVGGRGNAAVTAMKKENIVAMCDVDEARAAKNFA